jgi:peptide deformylase
MALLSVLQFPDPRLRTKALMVEEVNATVRKIVDDMFETMYEYGGVGLASTQVAVYQRIVVMDVSDHRDAPVCFINPEIIHREGLQYESEGCLSFPSIYDKVERAAKVRVQALDKDGKSFQFDAEELTAICIQHEIDHLNGVLFIDHLSRLKQTRVRAKVDKTRRRTSAT